ncbi:MAG: EMC3/TMCO1 family protein [Candidatus Anstonellales archaeon]
MFFYIVLFIALVYVLLIRIIRPKFVDMERMKKMQERTKEMSKEMKEASKKKDMAKMEQLNKAYMEEIMPEMNAVMIQQLKFTFVIIVLFSGAIFLLSSFDTSTHDDIKLNLTNVDAQWIGSFKVDAPGVWRITAKTNGIFGGSENQTYIFVGSKGSPPPLTHKGEPMPIIVNNEKIYEVGDAVSVSVLFHEQPEIIVDRGTRFSAPLPFEIFGIKEIEGASSWFIIDLIVLNIIIAIGEKIYGKMRKK